MKRLFFVLSAYSLSFAFAAIPGEIPTPSLPHINAAGDEISCAGDAFILSIDKPADRRTVFLDDACPKSFLGEGGSGVFATFDDGVSFVSYRGEKTRLTTVAPRKIYGSVREAGAIALFGNGLYLLKSDGKFAVLALTDPEILFGANANGIVAQYTTGVSFIRWDGTFVLLSAARPKSMKAVGSRSITACYGNGLYEIEYSGRLILKSATCE